MEITPLIQKIKCTEKAGKDNFSLSAGAAMVKGMILSKISDLKEAAINTAKSVITGMVNTIKNEITSIKDIVKSYDDQYNNIKKQITSLSGVLDCPEAGNNVSVNASAAMSALPRSNNPIINKASNDKINKNILEDSKTTTPDKMLQAVIQNHTAINLKGTVEAKEDVRKIKNLHPTFKPQLKQLTFFKDISNYIGYNVLAYTTDKPALNIVEWERGIPQYIRTNINHKIDTNIADELQNQYSILNKKFTSNLSDEALAGFVPVKNRSEGWHLQGDVLFYDDHIAQDQPLYQKTYAKINSIIGSQTKLIDYFYPIKVNITVKDESFNIDGVIIDKRGNIIREPFKVVNNIALKPVESIISTI